MSGVAVNNNSNAKRRTETGRGIGQKFISSTNPNQMIKKDATMRSTTTNNAAVESQQISTTSNHTRSVS